MKMLPTSRVGEILDAHPPLIGVFKRFGFGALANPMLRKLFAGQVTIEMACRKHGVPPEELIAALEAAIPNGVSDATTPAPVEPAATLPVAIAEDGPVLATMTTGECVAGFPETREVFRAWFGEGCFSCPAFGTEDLATAAIMHGVEANEFVAACNRAVADKKPSGTPPSHRVPAEATVNDIRNTWPETAPILHDFGIDACCGGMHPLQMACQAHGADLETVRRALDEAILRAGRERAPQIPV